MSDKKKIWKKDIRFLKNNIIFNAFLHKIIVILKINNLYLKIKHYLYLFL